MEIDKIYDTIYNIYENNLKDEEIKKKIEPILFDIDWIYEDAQSKMYDKLLEIKKIA